MLTADRYEALTGQSAPDDLPAVIGMAETILHARTMQLLRGRELTGFALDTWEQAIALQAAFTIERGGVAGLADAGSAAGSVSLGRFSLSGGGQRADAPAQDAALSPAAAALLPTLIAIGRGLS